VIFLLEGPDLAGKTTLAQSIADMMREQYPNYIIHMHKRGPLHKDVNPMDEYLVPLHEMTRSMVRKADDPRPREIHIIDRWHAGELVYGPILRGASRLSRAQFNYIELVLYTYGVTPIYVNSALPTLQQRYDVRGDSLSWNQIESAYRAYLDLLMLDNDHYRRVYTDTPWASSLAMIDITQTGTGGAPIVPWWEGYLGGRYPRVLLLGDKQGPNPPAGVITKLSWPFAPWRTTSGHWLFEALHEAKVNVHNVGLVNACERTPEALSSLWKRLDNPPVVTLGVHARRAAEAAEIPRDAETQHPQFMRRFHHDKLMDYGQAIKNVMR
jgi:thymidylate kinase